MITFVTGGARSGKSSFALSAASGIQGRRAYIATAQALDDEMQLRIEKHKQERSSAWDTFEEPRAISMLVREINGNYDVVLIDCLTLWLSNLMMDNADIPAALDLFLAAVKDCKAELFIVSNEVGMGIVPDNEMARLFRDYAGTMNRLSAEAADRVYMLCSGIPVRIK